MKVVVAPNAFKGSLTATQAAAAIARGVSAVFPDAEIVEIPVADGGDGTVEALVTAHRGAYRSVEVEGPLGDPVKAVYGLVDFINGAPPAGVGVAPVSARVPRKTSTYGFGERLEAVRKAGARAVIAGIGGSATNDGGAGMAQALGYRLLDRDGRDLPRGGIALLRLDRIDGSGLDPGWHSVKLMGACDVTNPLTGPKGASYVYGPQKGAEPGTVRELREGP